MSKTEEQYIKVTNKCRLLFENKMKDYGCAWRILRLESLTDQIFIKAQRIRGLQLNQHQMVIDSEIEEFMGIINYSIMALIQIESGNQKTHQIVHRKPSRSRANREPLSRSTQAYR